MSRAGFTLLEVMVALLVLGLVTSTVFAIFSTTVDSKARVEAYNEMYQTSRQVLDRAQRELSLAFLSPSRQANPTLFLGEDAELRGYPMDSITFTSFSHVPMGVDNRESEECELSYFVIEDSSNEVRYLMRREDGSLDLDPLEGGVTYEMAPDIRGINFRFWDGSSWHDSWDSREAESGMQLPYAVELTLILPGLDDRDEVFQSRTVLKLAEAHEELR
ncbi:MAG: type II secretion system protein GspJ [Candidatus Alcyoniella australis]|nr:type II secretion system protein GspJ [Candidatus Alcyoniella australis]